MEGTCPRLSVAPAVIGAERSPADTIPALLRDVIERFGGNEFVVADGERLTYAQIDERSLSLSAKLLRAGVGKGTRVAVIFPSGPDFVVTWTALVRIGAVAVPINTLVTASELRDIMRFADVQHLIATPHHLRHDYAAKLVEAFPELAHASSTIEIDEAPFLRSVWFDPSINPPADPPINPPTDAAWAGSLQGLPSAPATLVRAAEDAVTAADAASIVFSSGSTGTPKAVIHTHGTLTRQAGKLQDDWNYDQRDRIYTSLPFFWVGGLSFVLLTTMTAGATVVIATDNSPAAVLDLLERERVTVCHCWPHTARLMASDPTFADRTLVMWGGSLHEAWIGDGNRRLLADSLGMTETAGPHTSGQHRPVPEHLRGSFGIPVRGLEHRIVDPDTRTELADGERGELMVRGDTVTVGLHRRERHEVFDADGWYRTGDLCSMREGHLFFHGRVDDQMKVSGVNVAPNEVERVLLAMAEVAQAFVVGVPDDARGAVVAAALVAAPGADIDPHAVVATAKASLASYKVPRVVAVFASGDIPMKSTGKLDRLRLIELLSALPPSALTTRTRPGTMPKAITDSNRARSDA